MFEEILENVKSKTPLVHAITNYVTVNDCANITLAAGASPVMADDINEVEDIVSISSALVINMGTLNERTVKSMLAAGKKANKLGRPVIFDPVGAGASAYRNATASALMKEIKFSVIKGNLSEIKFLAGGKGNTRGVDASAADAKGGNIDGVINIAKKLAEETRAVISITGAADVISDGKKTFVIRNGHPDMGKITGAGCMLACLTAAYCGANEKNILEATAAAAAVMALSGELAHKKLLKISGGINSYRTLLIDAVGAADHTALKEVKLETH